MALSPPVTHPSSSDVPVLLSVPHAGRDYPEWLVSLSKAGRSSLHALEDPLVDELVAGSVANGIGAVVARAPRAAVDCNRSEDEIDPTVVRCGPIAQMSPRARGGLGIVPGRTASHGPLWRQAIPHQELESRLDQAHRPYHSSIEEQLRNLLERFGCALLIDCHSMPSPGGGSPAVILGDRYGHSAAPFVTAEAVKIVSSLGFRAGVNQPFAGGYVVQRHGAPERGVHAIQVEVDRNCYLTAEGVPSPGFAACSRLFDQLARRLGQFLLDRRYAAAAE